MLPFTEEAKDAFDNDEREFKEIEGIAPEIKEKIADTKDMQQVGDRCLVENMITQVAATKERAENGKIFLFKFEHEKLICAKVVFTKWNLIFHMMGSFDW